MNCRRNKRLTRNALRFEIDLERGVLVLSNKLKDRTYSPGKSICFAVTHPKTREIFAADFPDRIVHHLLINEIEEIFEKGFIHDSFACRKGKGTHKAVERLQHFLQKATKNRTKNAYFLQLDIKSFFPSLDKNILFEIVKRQINKVPKSTTWKKDILWLSKVIIFHDPTKNFRLKSPQHLMQKIPKEKSLFRTDTNTGLPIGNLTSQFFANVYLNELDQFIKRHLKVKYYLRYVDDLLLLSDNPQKLIYWREEIDYFLKIKLKLRLHPDKDKAGSVCRGIDFLGYVVLPCHILVRKRVIGNLKTKLYSANRCCKVPDKKSVKKTLAMLNSYYGHFRKANSYNLRKNIAQKHLGLFKTYFEPVKNLSFFRPRKPPR